MTVVRESLLQGMEAPICQPVLSSREVCWESHIQDVVKGLIQPSDYNSLLLFLVGTNAIARGDLGSIKHDYRVMGTEVEGMGSRWCSP